MENLAAMLDLTNAALMHTTAVFFRVSALVALLPAFGERTLPVRIKFAVMLAFTLVIVPAVPRGAAASNLVEFALLLCAETLVGLLIGIGLRLLVMGLQTTGSIAAQSTSLSQILGGAAVDPLPAMGHILIVGALALAVISGLHVKAAEMLIRSYDLFPIGQFPNGAAVSAWGTSQVARAFALAFTLAAPFVILSVLYNLALGAINKAMPQLMVAFVGAPVITAGGLFILWLAAPYILEKWLLVLDSFLANPYRVPQ